MLERIDTPETLEKHPVSELHEYCHQIGKHVEYKEMIVTDVFIDGENRKMMRMDVFVDGEMVGRGISTKKEVAKKKAARAEKSALESKRKREEEESKCECKKEEEKNL